MDKLVLLVEHHQLLLSLYHIRYEVKESHVNDRFCDGLRSKAPISANELTAGLLVSIALFADAEVDWCPTASEGGGIIS